MQLSVPPYLADHIGGDCVYKLDGCYDYCGMVFVVRWGRVYKGLWLFQLCAIRNFFARIWVPVAARVTIAGHYGGPLKRQPTNAVYHLP